MIYTRVFLYNKRKLWYPRAKVNVIIMIAAELVADYFCPADIYL